MSKNGIVSRETILSPSGIPASETESLTESTIGEQRSKDEHFNSGSGGWFGKAKQLYYLPSLKNDGSGVSGGMWVEEVIQREEGGVGG